MQTEGRIAGELVREFVMAAHGNLERVHYNWGGDDWETALGAAAHVLAYLSRK